jgi:hypothetical protein
MSMSAYYEAESEAGQTKSLSDTTVVLADLVGGGSLWRLFALMT